VNLDRSEGGFTLVEMLIVIVISAVLMGGLVGGVMVAIRTYPENAGKLVQSHDAQLLASWLVPDVQSGGPASSAIDTGSGSSSGCTTGVDPSSSNALKLTWSGFDTPTTTFEADYRLVGLSSPFVLTRYFCQNSGPAISTIIGRNIATATAINPVGTNPNRVDVTVTDVGSSGSTFTIPTYSFTVSASRRSTQIPPPTPTTLPPATTTTTIPCQIATAAATPQPDHLTTDGTGHLQTNVAISLTTTGICTGLQLTIDTGNGTPPTVPLTSSAYGSTWTGTIAGNLYSWTAGTHPLTVVDSQSSVVPPTSTNPVTLQVSP
jgi:prepilin-type N-terminal cleavage/methylation domain-containing protein